MQQTPCKSLFQKSQKQPETAIYRINALTKSIYCAVFSLFTPSCNNTFTVTWYNIFKKICKKRKISSYFRTYIYEGAIKHKAVNMMDKGTDIKTVVIADEQIIELYWERNETAIQETETKYGKMLFRIAYNILHDRLDSEECKNDTYIGVWNAIPPTKPNVFPAFITQIMRNIATKRYKEN